MDKRILKNGRYRYRFKLSLKGYDLVKRAIEMTECKFDHVAIERIFWAYFSISHSKYSNTGWYNGNERFLVKMYRDQVELFDDMLTRYADEGVTEEEALCFICASVLSSPIAVLDFQEP